MVDYVVLNCVKRFLEIQFEDDGFPSRMLTLVYVFKAPCQAILYSARSNKAVLIFVHNFEND